MPQQQGEVLTGDIGANTIRGTGGKDVLSGQDGDDVIVALGSSDAVSGGAGADILLEGNGDGILVADRADVLLDGGDGIDTVILGPGATPYTFSPTNMKGIEAIQDAPGSDTTIVFDARILANTDDDSFLFALGDGTDEVRISNSTGAPVTVNGDEIVYNGEVVLRFQGVENLTLTGGDGDSSSVVTQSLSPGQDSSTTVRTFSGDGDNTTTVTSVTTGTEGDTSTAAAETTSSAQTDAVAGPASPAATIAQALFGGETTTTSLNGLAEQLSDLLEAHAEAAAILRTEVASSTGTGTGGNLFADDLFGPTGLFGLLLSDDILARAEADLVGAA